MQKSDFKKRILSFQTSLRFASYLSRQSSDFKNSRCYVTAVSSSFQNIQKHYNRVRIENIRAKTVPTGKLIMTHSLFPAGRTRLRSCKRRVAL